MLGLAALLVLGCGDDGTTAAVDADTTVVTVDSGTPDAGQLTRFVASWTLAGGCIRGDVVELEVASTGDGRVTTNRFPCTATSGTSGHVGGGTFEAQLRVIDTDLEMLPDAGVGIDGGPGDPEPGPLVAISDRMTDVASVLNTDTPIAFAFATGLATIESSWTFKDGETMESCTDAGVVNIELEYLLVGDVVQRMVTLPCTDLTETTPPLATGLYLVTAKALDGVGAEVWPEVEAQTVLFVGNQSVTTSLGFTAPPI